MDITITIPDEQIPRVRAAFTFALELDEPATLADLKSYIITDLKQLVRNAEQRKAAQEAVVDSMAPDIR